MTQLQLWCCELGAALASALLVCARRRRRMLPTPSERAAWRRDGFFIRRGFFSAADLTGRRPNVNAHEKERMLQDQSVARHVLFGAAQTGEDPSKVVKLEQLRDVCRFRGLFALAQDWRLQALARRLIGCSATLMKDKYIFKAARQGGAFTPHQDMQARGGRWIGGLVTHPTLVCCCRVGVLALVLNTSTATHPVRPPTQPAVRVRPLRAGCRQLRHRLRRR